jgi:hypothetical protein
MYSKPLSRRQTEARLSERAANPRDRVILSAAGPQRSPPGIQPCEPHGPGWKDHVASSATWLPLRTLPPIGTVREL